MRKVLMVAFHFPPLAGSSGIQRTLRFAQHLPGCGWQPLVLSASPRAYERTSDDLNASIPVGTVVRRAQAFDTARHLALRGRYVGAMARPDRWVSWRFDGVRQGMRMIREFKPDAIWSTYPIATAHLIGAELQRRSGLPWIADFRDPMVQEGYPADPLTWQQYREIEAVATTRAALCTFTTPGAAADYRLRYPDAAARMHVIENGYDEETFANLALGSGAVGPLSRGCITLLHSGIVYPSERDPSQLMMALRRLHDAGKIQPGRLKLRFRASMADALLLHLAEQHGVLNYVEVCPPIPYRDALAEMMRADGLLIMQASNCNAQIPAKLYEYLRAGRSVLCLTDPAGDTAQVLGQAGIDAIARLDAEQDIASLLARFVGHGDSVALHTLPQPAFVKTASRKGRTQALAQLLAQASDR